MRRAFPRVAMCLGILAAAWPLCPAGASAQAVTWYDTGEEFVGPFPSWKNVKTDYGAKGDGVANDTTAIQKALDDLKNVSTNDWCVLYFPAGTYRIDDTLKTVRKEHNDYLGANLVGEDPAQTTIVWDGPADKPMLRYDAWYCKVSRLAFDGRGKANSGLVRAGGFSTYCEISDLVFQDINGIALNLGNAEQDGAAEHAVLRCRFLRCKEGISTINWNTLDIYVWYCLFEDCGRGIYNRMGGYQAYGNVFLRSKEMDIGSMNGMCFAVVNNTSIGSKVFAAGSAGNCYMRGNRVYNTTEPAAVNIGAALVMLDNTIVSRPEARGAIVNLHPAGSLMAGNTFTAADWPVRPNVSLHPSAGTLKQEMAKAIDNDAATDFVDVGCNDPNNRPHPSIPGAIQWNGARGAQRKVNKYTLTAGSDPRKAPRDWRLLGSQVPGSGWTVLDTQKDQAWSARGEKKEFTIRNTGAFGVYRFEVTANGAGTPGMRLAEIELLDDGGRDLTEDKDCLMTGRNEPWGQHLSLQQKVVAPEILSAPATVSLPGPPPNRHRKVFDVSTGSGDDARELQEQILATAKEPVGSRPVVHVPKGTLRLKRTVTVPALVEIQIVGDGGGNGSALNYDGGPGPVLLLEGPSRASLRDLDINGGNTNGVDGLVITNADQPGGRIYGDQLNASGFGGTHMITTAIAVDGLEHSDVTITGLRVRGGKLAAAGGQVANQVAFLTGSSSHGCRLLDVADGGSVIGEAFWYEGDWDYQAALLDLSAASRGNVSLAAAWWHMDSPKCPLVSIDGLAGKCTILASSLDDRNGAYVQLRGDGAKASFFLAGSEFVSGGRRHDPRDAWVDRTSPPAQAAMFACNDATVSNKADDVLPDATLVLGSLAQLRSLRIEPPMGRRPGLTDVKLHRVKVSAGDGKDAVRIEAAAGRN
jgi:Pectate lyase superfamily protein